MDNATTTPTADQGNTHDELVQEAKALRTMLNYGLTFNLPKKSFLKWFSKKKERTFFVHNLFLSSMDRLAEVNLKMRINQERLRANPINEKNIIIKENNLLVAKSVSIAVLNSTWKSKLFGWFLTIYFRNRMNSEKSFQLAQLIDEIQDAGNFINSIGLLSGMMRTSQPKPDPIEEKQ